MGEWDVAGGGEDVGVSESFLYYDLVGIGSIGLAEGFPFAHTRNYLVARRCAISPRNPARF